MYPKKKNKKTRERHSTTCKCIHIYSLLITCQPHSTHTLCYCLAHCFLSSAIFPSPPHWERLHFSLLKFPRSTFFFLVTLLALIWREKTIYLLLSTHVDKTKQSTVINLTLISFGLLYFFSHSKNKLCFHSWNKKVKSTDQKIECLLVTSLQLRTLHFSTSFILKWIN